MNTKVLMTSSAIFTAILGILISFLPDEILTHLNIENNSITLLFLKLIGAMYMGFAVLNWMAKGTLIGGIYNRPIAFANLMHFGIGAVAFAKAIPALETHKEITIAVTVVYGIFALLFVYVFRTNPARVEKG